tara:strand:- start:1598 stop:1894 length:297 start_codon:yes stop_codon:yes gene_type:complete
VIRGAGYPHKVPTANVVMEGDTLEDGAYLGECHQGGTTLGPCAVWVMPHAPDIAEVFVAGYEGDLYGEELEVVNMERLGRDQQREMYDRALLGDYDDE